MEIFDSFSSMAPEISNFVKGMEGAGRLAAETLTYVSGLVRPGVKTIDLDREAEEFIRSPGGLPAPLNYYGYPRSICTSINEVICHGVPDNTVLKNGDIVNIDITAILNGYHGDTSMTVPVGVITENAKLLMEAAEMAMFKGIEAIEPGATTGDIGFATNKFVTKKGYHVVRDIRGHRIGVKFHDEPFVPAYGKKGKGDPLKTWRCITVEPMINETSSPMEEHEIPGSTIRYYTTADRCLSAQFEHTVLITDKGYQILTLRE